MTDDAASTGPVALTGSRVILRDWTHDDVDALLPWISPPPGGGVHSWQRTDAPYFQRWSADGAAGWCRSLHERVDAGDWPTPRESLAIVDVATGDFVGQVSWYYQEHGNRPADVAEGTGTYALPWIRLGIGIYRPDHWNGGYGTEAMSRWTDYLFATTTVGRLDYATWSGNVGMCRIGPRLGYREEARFRRARLVDGVLYDSVVYGVLREEWDAARSG